VVVILVLAPAGVRERFTLTVSIAVAGFINVMHTNRRRDTSVAPPQATRAVDLDFVALDLLEFLDDPRGPGHVTRGVAADVHRTLRRRRDAKMRKEPRDRLELV